MAKNHTRRNKSSKDRKDKKDRKDRKDKRNKTEGGKRAKRGSTRKISKGASNWQQTVMKVYKDMKTSDPNVKLGDAMKRASELKKKGQL